MEFGALFLLAACVVTTVARLDMPEFKPEKFRYLGGDSGRAQQCCKYIYKQTFDRCSPQHILISYNDLKIKIL